jgi:hypothetical protein
VPCWQREDSARTWNEDPFHVLEDFPDLAHDDEVDACSDALEMLNPPMKGWNIYELYRREAEASRDRILGDLVADGPVRAGLACGSRKHDTVRSSVSDARTFKAIQYSLLKTIVNG